MKTKATLSRKTLDMIRWQLRMHDRFLTCRISTSPASGFEVVTLPHPNVHGGTVEVFADLASALQRHAAIVDQLRSSGWSIASYTQ